MYLRVFTKLQNKYKITEHLTSNKYTVKYLAEDNNYVKYIIIEFFPTEILNREDQNLIVIDYSNKKHFEDMKEIFLEKAENMRKLNLSQLPEITDVFIENNTIYVVYKAIKENSLNSYIKQKEKLLNYKEAYEILKNLFVAIDIAVKNNIYFKLTGDNVLIDKEDNIKIFTNYLLEYNHNDVIKDLANIYYKMITGGDFYATLKKPSKLGITVPVELENMLYDTLTSKKHFISVEEFNNRLRDTTSYSLKKDNTQLEKNKSSNSSKINISKYIAIGCFGIFIITMLFIFSVYFLGNYLSNIYLSENSVSKKLDEHFYDNNYDYDVLLSKYYLDDSNFSPIGSTEEKDGYIYINALEGETWYLFKKNEHGTDSKILAKDLIMKYMIVYENYIYFCNVSDQNKLYKIKTDGTGLEKIIDKQSYYIQITSKGNLLYYVTPNELGDGYQINTVKVNGSDNKKIMDYFDSNEFVLYLDMYNVFRENYIDKIDDIKIYYSEQYGDYYLYRNNLYCIDYYKSKIVSLDLKGDEILFPFDIDAEDLAIYGDFMYYVDLAGDLYKLNLVNREEEKIVSDCYKISKITKNLIFYYDYNENLIQHSN